MSKILSSVVVLSLLFACPFLQAAPLVHAAQNFVSIADIHFDPFNACYNNLISPCPLILHLRDASPEEWQTIFEKEGNEKIASAHQDTNYALLKSSLMQIHTVVEIDNPVFVVILGDFLSHHFRARYIKYSKDKSKAGYQEFVKKTFQFLTWQLRRAIPNKDIYPAIGNNDSYDGDYYIEPQGKFLHDLAKIWSVLILNKENRISFLAEFPIAGYYGITPATNKGHRLLMLNTVLFSAKAPRTTALKTAAVKELNWLHDNLQTASSQHQPVLLACHIPFGIDLYTSFKSMFSRLEEFWLPQYTEVFRQEAISFSPIIKGLLAGHLHVDSPYFVAWRKPPNLIIAFTPSISPIFGNNPSFKVYHFDFNTFQLKDVDTYIYPITGIDAHGQGWQKEYGLPIESKHAIPDFKS